MNADPALADVSSREAITELRRHMQTCLDQLDAFKISGPDIHLDMALARFDMLFPFASDTTVSGVEQDERETS